MLFFYLSILDSNEEKQEFEVLYDTYNKRMFSIAYRITKNEGDAEEALQDAFFSISKNFGKIKTDNEKMLKSYLYTVIKNCALNICKKRTQDAFFSLDSLFDISNDEDVSSYLEDKEEREIILSVFKKIPSVCRDVLILHYLREFSVSEISIFLNLNKNTVKSRLLRGTKLLREMIATGGNFNGKV